MLYVLAGVYSGENPLDIIKNYGPAYLTAVGTMSSAATLAVALQCAEKCKPLRKDMVQFGIPLFANIHLCGSVLTEVFFCMTVSKILYGTVPTPGTITLRKTGSCFVIVPSYASEQNVRQIKNGRIGMMIFETIARTTF